MLNALLLLAIAAPQEPTKLTQFAGMVGTWKGKTVGMFGEGETTKIYRWSPSKAFLHYESSTKFDGEEPHVDFGHISWDASTEKATIWEFFEMGSVFKYSQSDKGGWKFKSVEVENNPMPGASARYEYTMGKDAFTEKLFITMDGKEELAVSTEFKRQK